MRTLIASDTRCRACTTADRGCEFRVDWRINPHMRIGEVVPARAHRQHERFLRELEALGARVIRLPFVHGAYDSVFVKDAAIVAASDGQLRVLPATARHDERGEEPGARADQLARLGFAVSRPLGSTLEGGDVVTVAHRRIALLGCGIRSARRSADGLSRFLRCEVVPLELREPSLFHLDTALAVLDDDTLVVCEDAFATTALRTLRALRFAHVVRVPVADALRFGINIVEVGGTIVTGTASPAMENRFGRVVVTAPLDEFHKAGGSAACLVATVHDLDAAAAAAAAA